MKSKNKPSSGNISEIRKENLISSTKLIIEELKESNERIKTLYILSKQSFLDTKKLERSHKLFTNELIKQEAILLNLTKEK